MSFLRLVCLSWLSLVSAAYGANEIDVSGDDNYPPIIFLNQQQPDGALPAILNEIGKQTGLRFRLQLYPWKRAYQTAVSGKSGLIGVSRNQEREQLFDFSEPLYFDDINLIAIKSRPVNFNSFDDLQNRRIGAQNGASFGEQADKEIAARHIELERDDSASSRLKKLLAGRLDLAIIGNGRAGLELLLKSDAMLNASRDQFVILARPLNQDPLYLAFPKAMKMQATLARINQAVLQLNNPKKRKAHD